MREWLTSTDHPGLTPLERQFVEAGAALADAEEQSAVERARAQAGMIRRLRGTLAAAAVLLVLALVAGALAIRQADRAGEQATAARARQLSAQALGVDSPSLAALLAVEAVRLDDSPETRASLSAVFAAWPSLVSSSEELTGAVASLDVSPDGRTTAVYTARNLVELIDNATGRVEGDYDIDGPEVYRPAYGSTGPLAFSPDGRVLAVASQAFHPPALRLVDATSLEELPASQQPRHQPHLRAKGVTVAFSADGSHLAASFMLLASDDLRAGFEDPARALTLVWDLAHPHTAPLRVEVPADAFWEHLAISPDGSRVYVGAPLTAYDVRSGRRLWQDRSLSSYTPLDLTSDGRLLATPTGDKRTGVAIVDARSGRVVQRLTQPGLPIDDVRFSPDDDLLAAVSRRTRVYDLRSGSLVQDLDTTAASAAAFSPDGRLLYVGNARDDAVTTWDLTGTDTYLSHVPLDEEVATSFMRPAPDGQHVVVYPFEPGLSMVDVDTGSVTRMKVAGNNPGATGAWTRDSRHFATSGGRGGAVFVFDERGNLERRRRVSSSMVMDVDYSADGQRLLVGDLDGHVRLLDAATLEPSGPVVSLPGPVGYAQLSPDGRTAFVTTRPGPLEPGEDFVFEQWVIVDTQAGRVVRRGDLPFTVVFDDVSPDGRRVAMTSATGQLAVLSMSTGAVDEPPVQAHGDGAYWLAWSADGDELLTAAGDGTVDLWDAESWDLENSVALSSKVFTVAQFRPNSHDVLVLDQEGRAYVWDSRLQPAIDFACKVAGRELTEDEWRTYLGALPQQPVCPT